jgi:hypothetical protein
MLTSGIFHHLLSSMPDSFRWIYISEADAEDIILASADYCIYSIQDGIHDALSPLPVGDSDLPSGSTNSGGGRYRGGKRKALYLRFGKPFWEWLETVTLDQFNSCMPDEHTYIIGQISKRAQQVVDGVH